MISCTDFIPAYSELFSFLDENYGRGEVEKLWEYLFKPDGKGIPLINFARKDGLRGCWNYSNGTLSEEAADCTRYFSESNGWIKNEMHYCPSKGRLLELEKEIGLVPYYGYCDHCNYYQASYNEVGLMQIRDHTHVDEARCMSITIDPKKFNRMMHPDDNVEMLEIRAKEKEYFHPAFHSSINRGITYVTSVHGVEVLRAYFARYTKNVYVKVIEAMKTDALGALETLITDTYKREHASDVLTLEKTDSTLTVKIAYCPAVKFLKSIGSEITEYFYATTEFVMDTLAELGGIDFEMISYDNETGAAEYRFATRG